MFKTTFAIVFYILSGLWAMIWIGGGIMMYNETPNQIKRDKRFIEIEFKPKIAAIDSFKKVNGRLPTIAEFDLLMNINSAQRGGSEYVRDIRYVDQEISGEVRDIDWSKNYILQIWRGEWLEYYISSGNKFITNNYQTSDGIIAGFLIFPLIGLSPFILLWFYLRWLKPKFFQREQ